MIKIGNGLIYNGDCLEVMKKLPDKSVDLILCDLPYGTTSCSWDVVIPFESSWEQYKRLIKPKVGHFIHSITSCTPSVQTNKASFSVKYSSVVVKSITSCKGSAQKYRNNAS